MLDIGQRIRDELARQDRTPGWLARQLGVNRSVIHRNLAKTSIDVSLLQRIGIVLKHDFFRELSDEVKGLGLH